MLAVSSSVGIWGILTSVGEFGFVLKSMCGFSELPIDDRTLQILKEQRRFLTEHMQIPKENAKFHFPDFALPVLYVCCICALQYN